MTRPSLSVVLTIHDRSIALLTEVLDSLRGQPWDQLVLVADRSPDAVLAFLHGRASADQRVAVMEIPGPPGWLTPARAWNAGWERVTSDLVYCFSSDIIQRPDNVAIARAMLVERPSIIFGAVECSCGPLGNEVNWGPGVPGNLLVNSRHPRPLGFIWAGPMSAVRAVHGMDEGFMDGYWYDDDDFTYRLWKELPYFQFTDAISGVHQHHDRVELTRDGIERNTAYMMKKHGTLTPLRDEPITVHSPSDTLTVWTAA